MRSVRINNKNAYYADNLTYSNDQNNSYKADSLKVHSRHTIIDTRQYKAPITGKMLL